MAIKLMEVKKDLRSVLSLSNEDLADYKKLCEIIEWHLNTNKPNTIKDAAVEEIKKTFRQTFDSFLLHNGLPIADANLVSCPARIYTRLDDPKNIHLDVYCKGIKIIPGRSDVLDGFEPHLTFFINQQKPESIEVACTIKQDGMHLLRYLIEPTFLYYLKKPKEIIDKIIILPDEYDSFSFAPITQISGFLSNMKEIANIIGKENLKKLKEAKDAISTVPKELKETASNRYAATLLELLEFPITN